jgi:cytochrome c oxidase cbb3-type subunit I/II
MRDPRAVSPGSNMPAYPHLFTSRIDWSRVGAKIDSMRAAGVPYRPAEVSAADAIGHAQARVITDDLRAAGERSADPDSEIVALIAYLQRLGRPQGNPDTAQAVTAAMGAGR